jgi:hypothetical protein
MLKNLLLFLIYISIPFFASATYVIEDDSSEKQSILRNSSDDSSNYGSTSPSSSRSNSTATSPSASRDGSHDKEEGREEVGERRMPRNVENFQTPENDLKNYINTTVFNFDDPWGFTVSRWIGKVVGGMAAQGWDPLTMFMLFNMFYLISSYCVPVNSVFDEVAIALITIFLTPATSAHMGDAFETAARGVSGVVSRIPGIRRINPPVEIPGEYRLVSRARNLQLINFVYAGIWGALYASVLYHLENAPKDEGENRWFFWTFGTQYGLSVFWQLYTSLQQNNYMSWETQHREFATQNLTRNIIHQRLEAFLRDLSDQSDVQIGKHYKRIVSSKKSVLKKIKLWKPRSMRLTPVRDLEAPGVGNELNYNEYRPRTLGQNIARHFSYVISYGATISRFVLFSWVIDYALGAWQVPEGIAKESVKYSSAFILDAVATLFMRANIQNYFTSVFVNGFTSSYSASNPRIRRTISIISLPLGIILAMSDSWYAWFTTTSLPEKNTSSPSTQAPEECTQSMQGLGHITNSLRVPLLIFMLVDRLPMNATFLVGGYDRFFSSARHRTRQLFSWVTRRRIDPIGRGDKIDAISFATRRMQALVNQLNAEGVELVQSWMLEEEAVVNEMR